VRVVVVDVGHIRFILHSYILSKPHRVGFVGMLYALLYTAKADTPDQVLRSDQDRGPDQTADRTGDRTRTRTEDRIHMLYAARCRSHTCTGPDQSAQPDQAKPQTSDRNSTTVSHQTVRTRPEPQKPEPQNRNTGGGWPKELAFPLRLCQCI